MSVALVRAALLAWLVLPGPLRAQEPPVPPPEGGGEEQLQEDRPKQEEQGTEQDEKKDEKKDETQQQDAPPTPAPEAPPTPVEAPKADAGAPAGAPAPGAPATAPAPSRPAVTWPLSAEAVEAELRALAAAHVEVARLEVIGQSAGGREILALRLEARGEGLSAAKPLVLLIDHQGSESAGPEAALELAWQLCTGFAGDERVRALLSQSALVIAPTLDPDARSGAAAAPSPVRFERNFPSGWQPESVRPGSGRFSLSQPETLAVARYLAGLEGCAVVLGFAPSAPRGVPYAEAELPPADREVFGQLVAALELSGASALVPWHELGSPGGGPFDFAYQARGIYPLVFPLPAPEDLASGGFPAFAQSVLVRVQRCLLLLPRLELAQEGLERLASDTWQLDVRIQNVGIVPTVSALARQRALRSDVALHLEGARLVASAKKPASNAEFTDASFQVRAPLSGGTLAGGEGRWLRLLLEAGSGAEVRVTASSPWAGSDDVRIVLP